MSTPAIAANAYASLARISDPSAGLAKATGGEGGSFSDVLKNALGSVAQTGQRSHAQSQALATGKANIVDVVTAVSETEVAVEALVSVRDRMIAAYEEIMKMPI